jgi:hypothetical protein
VQNRGEISSLAESLTYLGSELVHIVAKAYSDHDPPAQHAGRVSDRAASTVVEMH